MLRVLGFLIGALVVALSWPLTNAQQPPHPCDMAPVAGGTTTAGAVAIGWCHNHHDITGAPLTITGWRLYRDAQPPVGITNAVTNGVPSASGDYFYQATVVFPAGNFIVTITAVSAAGEGGGTPPFALNVTTGSPALPSAPKLFRVV